MKKILIFGGTQYVGKEAINLLYQHGHQITVASRGNFPVHLGENISHIKCDRFDPKTYPSTLKKDWDIVIDQLAFNGNEAKQIVDYFKGRVDQAVLISSSAIYDKGSDCKEEDYIAKDHSFKFDMEVESEIIPDQDPYQTGKREAEFIYSTEFENHSLIRYPKVFAVTDLSTRMLELIYLIVKSKKIPVADLDKKMSFIHLRDASRFITWICQNKHLGTFNACSNGVENANSLIKKLNGEPDNVTQTEEELSIFAGHEIVLNTQKAKSLGFIFEDNSKWMDEVSKVWSHYIRTLENYNSKF
jgi:nucleoside-diphosphate-sugar epimerase